MRAAEAPVCSPCNVGLLFSPVPMEVFLKILSLGCYFQPTLKKISSPDLEGTVAESDYNGTGMLPFIFYTF